MRYSTLGFLFQACAAFKWLFTRFIYFNARRNILYITSIPSYIYFFFTVYVNNKIILSCTSLLWDVSRTPPVCWWLFIFQTRISLYTVHCISCCNWAPMMRNYMRSLNFTLLFIQYYRRWIMTLNCARTYIFYWYARRRSSIYKLSADIRMYFDIRWLFRANNEKRKD